MSEILHRKRQEKKISESTKEQIAKVPKKKANMQRIPGAALKYRQLLFLIHNNKKLAKRVEGRRDETKMTRWKRTGNRIVLLFFVVVAVMIVGKYYQNKKESDYATDKISVLEVKTALNFGVYSEEEWDRYFAVGDKDYLTGNMLEHLLARLGLETYIEKPKISKRHKVTREEWNAVYVQILDYLDMDKSVAESTFLVLDTIELKNENVIVTNQGDYYTKLPTSWFKKWQAYHAYTTGQNLCIGIHGISKEEQTISNAYLKKYVDKKIYFLYGGAEYEKEIGAVNNDLIAGVYDFALLSGEIRTVRSKQDRITGDLLSYDDTTVEIEGYGKISHAGKIPVYQTYGDIVEKSIFDVVLGNMQVEYITGENQVCAILIEQPANIKNIRVLLLNEDGDKFRSDVYLKCTTQNAINCGKWNETLAEGSLLHVTDYISAENTDSLILTPSTADGQVFICDESGNALSNGYYGTMEVRKYEEGYTLVNQLPLETYLCAVVPSEMPSTYEPEALKAQAICARSYAYIQLLRADLRAYGAHIDDSTAYQVYNKIAPTEQSMIAVYETAGKVLTYQEDVVEAFYFSTSMGYTDTEEIWNVENEYGYLKQACLNTPPSEGELSDETAFGEYIKKSVLGYDSDIKYYRWTAVADYSKKTAAIREILESRRAVSEINIQFYNTNQTKSMDSMKSMGALKSISVAERSDSGAILTLKLTYKKGIVLVKNEYNIRKILGCGVTKITYQDGSENTNVSLLPSSFCTITSQEDGTMLLQGGGYGHGLGMSQNGANGMAKAGMKCEDILQYFYHDIKIEFMGK